MCTRADNDIIIILGQYKLVVDQSMLSATGLLSGVNNYSRSCTCTCTLLYVPVMYTLAVFANNFYYY